jgi:hypothetical protein
MRQRRTYDKIGCDEEGDALAGGLGTVICHGEAVEIDDVCERVDKTPDEDRPAGSFVQGEIFVERNDGANGRAAQNRDEVAANGEEDEDDVNVQQHGSRTSNNLKILISTRNTASESRITHRKLSQTSLSHQSSCP